MILAGDIGGTNARLAYFQPQNGHLRLVSERVFPSREHSELGEIVTKFLDDSGTRPEVACFGIAGPVHNGRVETSNLPWVIEQSHLAKQIHLPATLLINDLEAIAWGIGALDPTDLVALNRVSGPTIGNQAVIAPGTGLGEAGLFWDGSRHHVFACEGGHTDFAPTDDQQIEFADQVGPDAVLRHVFAEDDQRLDCAAAYALSDFWQIRAEFGGRDSG